MPSPAIKIISAFLLVTVVSCAFNVPEKNPITQNNLLDYNRTRAFEGVVYFPEFPNRVNPDHPLYKSVHLGTVSGIPDVIRNINIAIASDEQFKEALRETLRGSNLLSEYEKNAKYFLDANYKDSQTLDLKVVVNYQLRDKDVASPLLDREISRLVIVKNLWGGMNWEHARTAKQFSHLLNISSITWCLEQYNGVSFPDDCNLVFINREQMKTKSFKPEDTNKITERDISPF